MTAFVYRCPTTGFNVQGFRSDDPRPASPSAEEVYETVTCTACRSVHLVNPLTGHVAGGHSKTKR